MEFEFVYGGIINFINMSNNDHSIIEPSAILIRADDTTLPPGHDHDGQGTTPSDDDKDEGNDHRHTNPHGAGEDDDSQEDDPNDQPTEDDPKPDNNHIPYLAFDSRLVTVNLPGAFREVPNAPPYRFFDIGGMEVVIENHGVGVPILDRTFDYVLGTEEYWQEAQGRWNPDAVPPRGQRPKKSVVASWMRFGQGKMSGGRLCPFKWKFTKLNGDTFSRHCAEEAIYSFEETESTQIRITLKDLEDGENELVTFVFRPLEGNRKVTLFIGNNIASDIESAVRRRRPSDAAGPAGHFAFFNNIMSVGQDHVPQLPQSVELPGAPKGLGGGGTDGGICGPKNG